MSNIRNFNDEKITTKIIHVLYTLNFNAIHKLAEYSGIPVHRLADFVGGTEKITQLDKGKLIVCLVKLFDMGEWEGQLEETEEQKFTALKEFQQRKFQQRKTG